ncbi:MAG: peptidase M22 [Firmicutes bacterium]|nr:peptidase M22 [Bacillota bacterium]
MSLYLGIDTSNYTTSAALYDTRSGSVIQQKMLLPVKAGERGIRQSDAVFHHTNQLPQIISALRSECGGFGKISAVGASARPRSMDGSYMPCFTVGHGMARILSDVMGIPLGEFSHQEGHIAAALYSSGRMDLMSGKFIAFHVSGGTTEAVLAEGDGLNVRVRLIAQSLDLKAGQVIDRTAVMLGLPFPGGKYLEKLALTCDDAVKYKPAMKGHDCSLSGIENKCKKMFESGEPHNRIAKFCLTAVMNSIIAMTDALIEEYGDMPLVYAGGVMSNSLIRNEITQRYQANFAAPEFSCDNAAGTAILTSFKYENTYLH